jgi:hypothetical protein
LLLWWTLMLLSSAVVARLLTSLRHLVCRQGQEGQEKQEVGVGKKWESRRDRGWWKCHYRRYFDKLWLMCAIGTCLVSTGSVKVRRPRLQGLQS